MIGVALLLALLFFGGASRADAQSQPFIRVFALLLGGAAFWWMSKDQWRSIRSPALFLAAYCALCLAYLLPLPPALWSALPGRGVIAAGMAHAGIDPVWRPASLDPDRTLNALLAALPGIATLAVLAILPARLFARIPLALLAAIAASALVGLSQSYSGWPYTYRITNLGTPVGLFANRNHAALLITMAIPLSCHVAITYAHSARNRLVPLAIFAAAVVVVMPLLLVNGSRGGLVVAVIGLAGSAGMIARAGLPGLSRRAALSGAAILGVLVAVIFAAFLLLGRDMALTRLFDAQVAEDLRARALPTILEMIRTYFPIGSGIGTFEPAFKIFEPDALISNLYLNHAHNDWLEAVSDAGVLGAALALAVIAWATRTSWRWWSIAKPAGPAVHAMAGSIVLVQLLVASALDYPLRTPMMSAICFYALTTLAQTSQLARSRFSASRS
jgi:O-antigen ligase